MSWGWVFAGQWQGQYNFFCESGRKADTRHVQTVLPNGAKRTIWDCWLMIGRQLQVPQCIVETTMRPDMALYSECERIFYFIELMIPFEDANEEAFEAKVSGTGTRNEGMRLASTNKTSVDRCQRLCSWINHNTSVRFWFSRTITQRGFKGWGCWKSEPVVVAELYGWAVMLGSAVVGYRQRMLYCQGGLLGIPGTICGTCCGCHQPVVGCCVSMIFFVSAFFYGQTVVTHPILGQDPFLLCISDSVKILSFYDQIRFQDQLTWGLDML